MSLVYQRFNKVVILQYLVYNFKTNRIYVRSLVEASFQQSCIFGFSSYNFIKNGLHGLCKADLLKILEIVLQDIFVIPFLITA